jgi:hypothetical protein
MPSILNLKFKGNKSFVAFSQLNDQDSLTKTWKVCTKVASFLEQGQRLENLSWRLWHLQNLMVDTDNARSKREFKKLSKCMSDKLDKEKGRSIEELEAPDFKRNHSTDMIRQRAVEKERNREASQNAKPGTIKRMQFTFSIDQPTPAVSTFVRKPDYKPSMEFKDGSHKRSRPNGRSTQGGEAEDIPVVDEANDKDPPFTQRGRKPATIPSVVQPPASLRFPTLFSNDFGPSALLHATPTHTTRMNYGEGVGLNSFNEGFSIVRPTIELPLDELLNNVDSIDSPWASFYPLMSAESRRPDEKPLVPDQDIIMANNTHTDERNDNHDDFSEEESDVDMTVLRNVPPISQTVKDTLPLTVAPSSVGPSFGNASRPSLTVKTQTPPNTRSSGPSATATSVNPAVLRPSGPNNSAPGGAKAECTNCGATHTPLWRRGLNDELNCNACGLYCKLHKRPRPKSMRNSHGEGRTQAPPRQECVDVMAQCYNCHTIATPLWRKDDEGKTVCNACGLYYKLHGSARPISMKSDVIRKRSRHDARRIGVGASDTPTASPGVSRRSSPVRDVSPTLDPDSTTQMSYEYNEQSEYQSSQSELMGALGPDSQHGVFNAQGAFSNSHVAFPGPYHPDYLIQIASNLSQPADAPPFTALDQSDLDNVSARMSTRTNKRRRMSNDSASETPSSAVSSYASYSDAYPSSTPSSTSHSQRSSMEFPFSSFPHYNILRGSANTFWHPPMLPQDNSPQFIHPPMLPPAEESPMDYLHPPMMLHDDDNLFSAYLHPPMVPPEEKSSMGSGQPHPPMFPADSMYGGNASGPQEHYDSAMQSF